MIYIGITNAIYYFVTNSDSLCSLGGKGIESNLNLILKLITYILVLLDDFTSGYSRCVSVGRCVEIRYTYLHLIIYWHSY